MADHKKRARAIVDGMEVWFRDGVRHRKTDKRDGRTPEEQIFDSGIFAASEFVRRMTGDEALSLAIHECCFWARRERERKDQPNAT